MTNAGETTGVTHAVESTAVPRLRILAMVCSGLLAAMLLSARLVEHGTIPIAYTGEVSHLALAAALAGGSR